MTIEKVPADQMLAQFKEQLTKLVTENQEMAAKIKQNEITALKLQGAIETLEYFNEDETEEETPEETEE
tara:strand:+ start:37244 stop:37450 length:207 start_codon:yes stop_codon:yes gene_type:complete